MGYVSQSKVALRFRKNSTSTKYVLRYPKIKFDYLMFTRRKVKIEFVIKTLAFAVILTVIKNYQNLDLKVI